MATAAQADVQAVTNLPFKSDPTDVKTFNIGEGMMTDTKAIFHAEGHQTGMALGMVEIIWQHGDATAPHVGARQVVAGLAQEIHPVRAFEHGRCAGELGVRTVRFPGLQTVDTRVQARDGGIDDVAAAPPGALPRAASRRLQSRACAWRGRRG